MSIDMMMSFYAVVAPLSLIVSVLAASYAFRMDSRRSYLRIGFALLALLALKLAVICLPLYLKGAELRGDSGGRLQAFYGLLILLRPTEILLYAGMLISLYLAYEDHANRRPVGVGAALALITVLCNPILLNLSTPRLSPNNIQWFAQGTTPMTAPEVPISAMDAVFDTIPSDGIISGPPGSVAGWGYVLQNRRTDYWLVTQGLNTGGFQYAPAISSLFDNPVVPPGVSIQVPFNAQRMEGLYQMIWAHSLPVPAWTNDGLFSIRAEWWTGDPKHGGKFLRNAGELRHSYSASLTPN